MFTTTASVRATCAATSKGPVLLRHMALNSARISIWTLSFCAGVRLLTLDPGQPSRVAPCHLLSLQKRRGRKSSDAIGRVEPGQHAREQRQRDGRHHDGNVHVHERPYERDAVWIVGMS